MAVTTPLPTINSNPLHNRPQAPMQQDEKRLWETVQKLQADLNQLIQHQIEVEESAP